MLYSIWQILLVMDLIWSSIYSIKNGRKREVALSSSNFFMNNDDMNFEKKLVLHYNFDDSDDIIQTNVQDKSKFENHGKFGSGSLIINIPKSSCKNAAYLYCSEIILHGSTFQGKPTYGITISAWVILLEKRGSRSIFEIYGENMIHPSYRLQINSNILYWYHRNRMQGPDIFSVVAEGIVEKRWTHIAATYNQTTGVGQLYVNGVALNRTIGRGTLSKDWSRMARIGGSECKGQLGGFIDDFRIYNYALKYNEILELMNHCSFGEKGPDLSPLVGLNSKFRATLSNVDVTEVGQEQLNERRHTIPNITQTTNSTVISTTPINKTISDDVGGSHKNRNQ